MKETALSHDRLLRALLPERGLRILFLHVSDVARHAAHIHGCQPTAALALAQTIAGAALLGGLGKGEQRVTLQVEGQGPLRGLFAEASADGGIRGWPRHEGVDFPGRDPADLSYSIGPEGYVSVIRELPTHEYYRAAVALGHSRLDRNLETYFRDSEQIPTTLGIWVEPTEDRRVGKVVALLAQRLPDGDEAAVEALRERIHAIEGPGRFGPEGSRLDPSLFEGLGNLEILESNPLEYRCGCSRDRAVRGVIAAGEQTILDMIAKDEGAELTCEFCKTLYRFETEELMRIFDMAHPEKDA